jgi:starch phosphorylase
VRFYGYSRKYRDGSVDRYAWEGGDVVIAVAFDTPIPGFNTFNTNNLRLWKSKPCNEFDFKSFNAGDYFSAINER